MTTLPLTHQGLLQPFKTKLLCLLKFGKEENLQKLADGKIYSRHLAYYKSEKNKGEPFYDPHEGLIGFYQSKDISIHLTPENSPPIILNAENGMVGQVSVSLNLETPAFCMHAIHTGEWTNRQFTETEIDDFKAFLQIPQKMENCYKATHVWLITNGDEFNKRVIAACKLNNIGLRANFVHYVDPEAHVTVPEELKGFVKTHNFSHEREYRYIFEAPNLPDEFILEVGSLRDISTVIPFEEFKNGWKIQFSE